MNSPAVADTLAEDPQATYDALVCVVMRMGSWLSSPQAQLLSGAEWNIHFQRYQEELARLRVMGDALRPRSLRVVEEPFMDELTAEVMELFAV